MQRMVRSRVFAARATYLCACALVTIFYLYLPFGGYERMMEEKYVCFLVLMLGYLAAMGFGAQLEAPRPAPSRIMFFAAAAYFTLSALSALFSPYGAHTLLGGSRREGLVTLALYAALFFCFARHLRADGRLLYLTAGAVALCDALVFVQTAGLDTLGLYPEGMGYFDGDVAYPGFFAGTSGNIDFTAFLLALACSVMLAALLRRQFWALAPVIALTLAALWRLGVDAAWAGLAFALLWCPALLFPQKRGAMLLLSAALTVGALVFLRFYPGDDRTLTEASMLLRGEIDEQFGSGRLWIWRNCLPLIRQRPLLGGGPDTLWLRGLEPFTWMRDGVAVPSDVTAAHNEYLGILVNQGAFALAAYLTLLGAGIVRCFRRAAEARFAICGVGLLCYAAMAMFSVSTCITAPYVWMLLALVQKDEIDC